MIALLKSILASFMALIVSYQLGAVTLPDIEKAENSYFQKNGKYLQIVRGELPHYENGTDKSKLGIDVPANVSIHVYKTSKGEQGYQVVTENPDSIGSIGYGVQAAEKTYTIDKS